MHQGRLHVSKTHHTSKTAVVRLLWAQTHVLHLHSLCLDVVRVVFDYLLPHLPVLVDLHKDYIRWFSYEDRAWHTSVPLSQSIEADSFSRWVLIEDNKVICSGGTFHSGHKDNKVISTVYEITLDGQVVPQPHMLFARSHHGVIVWKFTQMYVFGGCKHYVGSFRDLTVHCEALTLAVPRVWKQLPDMLEGKGVFNPCLYQDLIYLCGFGSTILEAFNPANCTFIDLNIELPEAHTCLLYVSNSILLVYTTTYLLRYSTQSNGQLVELTPRVVYREEMMRVQNSQPVLDLVHKVVYTVCNGKCYSFKMTTRYKGPVWALE